MQLLTHIVATQVQGKAGLTIDTSSLDIVVSL